MMPLSHSRVHMTRWLNTLAGAVASVFFPSGCRICETLLTRPDRLPLCDACLESFRILPLETCDRCGQPSTAGADSGGDVDGDENICRECHEREFAFDAARSFGIYEGALARAIVLMKFERIEPLGTWFAKRLAEAAQRIPAQ